MSAPRRLPRVLLLVQNLPVPFDRRVWQEACALRDNGYDVTVICPRGKDYDERHVVIDDIEVYRYSPGIEASGLLGYLLEYSIAILSMMVLAWRSVFRRGRLAAIQVCNPPDLLFMVALPFVKLHGTRLIFDHHDVSPELLIAKGHRPNGIAVRFACFLERLTFRAADVSIATNDSYRRVAIDRGGMSPEDVFVVRSGPNVTRFQRAKVDQSFKRGRDYLVAYVGVMGVQEGIDYLLDAAYEIVHVRGRRDVQFVLAGNGPEFKRLVARSTELRLDGYVEFLGRIPDAELFSLLRTADVCVNPDEVNRMNEISTMNKVLEYMAAAKPIVQFELHEGRVSAGASALYASPNDASSFADAVCALLDDEGTRVSMGQLGQRRFFNELAWPQQVPPLLAAYDRALRRHPNAPERREITLDDRSVSVADHEMVSARSETA